jgi:hypothetical protein
VHQLHAATQITVAVKIDKTRADPPVTPGVRENRIVKHCGGSINEVDLLVFTPQGFFLVEIKSRPGVLAGDAVTWLWTHEGREIAMDNPIFLANRKAKKLKALLSRQKACRDIRFPFIDAVIFCSEPVWKVSF